MSDVGIQPTTTAAQQAANAPVTVDADVASRATQTDGSFGGIDKDTFLELLVAQMRYQNPLQPMDGREFLGQAAQFAMVERLQSVLEAQNEAVAYQRVILSNSMIGKQALGVDEYGNPVNGEVDGVHYDKGQPYLIVDGARVPLDYVESIGNGNVVAGTPTTAGDPAATGGPGGTAVDGTPETTNNNTTTTNNGGTPSGGAFGIDVDDPASGAGAGGERISPVPTGATQQTTQPGTATNGATPAPETQEQSLS
jgi:flagellar basal-body rod modification protein FlgD